MICNGYCDRRWWWPCPWRDVPMTGGVGTPLAICVRRGVTNPHTSAGVCRNMMIDVEVNTGEMETQKRNTILYSAVVSNGDTAMWLMTFLLTSGEEKRYLWMCNHDDDGDKGDATTTTTTVEMVLLSFFSIPLMTLLHCSCTCIIIVLSICSCIRFCSSVFFYFLLEEVATERGGFTVLLVPYCLVQGVVFFCSCSA